MEKSEAAEANAADGRGVHRDAGQPTAVEAMFVLAYVLVVYSEVSQSRCAEQHGDDDDDTYKIPIVFLHYYYGILI